MAAWARDLSPDPGYSEVCTRLARMLPREHLSGREVNDSISTNAWEGYLLSLDYDRSCFLASDIAKFKAHELTLDDELKAGDLKFAYEVFEVFKQRFRDRCAYVEKLLKEGFDLHRQETLRWYRKDAPWPKNEAEWNELWRKRVQNEYVRQVIDAELKQEDQKKEPSKKGSETNAPQAAVRPPQTPEEIILNRYRRSLTVIEDSDAEWVLQKFLTAITEAYDPHSSYLSPSSMEDFDIEMKLSLVGIGALLKSEDGAAAVAKVIPGGPAARDKRDCRLVTGDKIIAVAQGDGEPVDILHWPLYKIVRLIRGEKGSRVVLTVIPASDPAGATTKLVDLVRDEVKLEDEAAKSEIRTVPDSDGVPRKLGVLTLPAFYASMQAKSTQDPDYRSSSDDVDRILRDLRKSGVDGIVLDLRSNGGGSLLEAVRMTGLFIRTGPVVQVRERFVRVLYDKDPSMVYSGPLIVLVSRLSASASEILAGALQDYGRALVVGDAHTHGKGSVQTILDLGRDKSLGSLKITSAVYYRVTGSSTQKEGVAADLVIPSLWESSEVGESSLRNPLAWSQDAPAAYLPVADLKPYVPTLREKSEKRRAIDPRFVVYKKLLDRAREIQTSKDISLNIDERRKLARAEKEMAALKEYEGAGADEEDDEDGEEGGDDKSGENPEKKGPDPVLLETLSVLADFVNLQQVKPRVAEEVPPPVEEKSFAEGVMDWLLERL